MNESSVRFCQTLMFLQFLLLAKIFRCEAGMKSALQRMWVWFGGQNRAMANQKEQHEKAGKRKGKSQ